MAANQLVIVLATLSAVTCLTIISPGLTINDDHSIRGFSADISQVNGETNAQCSYIDYKGKHIYIKYHVSRTGKLTIDPASNFTGDPKEAVKVCGYDDMIQLGSFSGMVEYNRTVLENISHDEIEDQLKDLQEEIQDHLGNALDKVQDLVANIKDKFHDKLDEIQDKMYDLPDKIKDKVENLREKVNNILDKVHDKVDNTQDKVHEHLDKINQDFWKH